jgi:hypothetical protein
VRVAHSLGPLARTEEPALSAFLVSAVVLAEGSNLVAAMPKAIQGDVTTWQRRQSK